MINIKIILKLEKIFLNSIPSINGILYLEYIKSSGRGNVLSKNDEVLDSSYYQMARAAYKSDKDLEGVFSVKDPEGNTMQLWDRGKTFHDKQTGMDAVVFERVVDGKTQVMVSFRGTEGGEIFEKDSLKPGEGMKDALTDA